MIERVGTDEPIVFQLMNQRTSFSEEDEPFYSIRRDGLGMHGMTLTTMYL
jgi:hypothetical protein